MLCRLVRDKDFRHRTHGLFRPVPEHPFCCFQRSGGVEKSFALVRDAGRVLYSPGRHAVWLAFPKRDAARFPEKEKAPKSERKLCTLYGFLFCFMAVVLAGAVILLINLEGGKVYADLVIYAGAAYAFFKITLAAINMVRARKKRSLSWMILRDIGYVDACVSILTLQIALCPRSPSGRKNFWKKLFLENRTNVLYNKARIQTAMSQSITVQLRSAHMLSGP